MPAQDQRTGAETKARSWGEKVVSQSYGPGGKRKKHPEQKMGLESEIRAFNKKNLETRE